jgi:hypothetical protein
MDTLKKGGFNGEKYYYKTVFHTVDGFYSFEQTIIITYKT